MSFTIEVLDVNEPPSIPTMIEPLGFAWDSLIEGRLDGHDDEPCRFEWSRSSDPDGNVVEYEYMLSPSPEFPPSRTFTRKTSGTEFTMTRAQLFQMLRSWGADITTNTALHQCVMASDHVYHVSSDTTTIEVTMGVIVGTQTTEVPTAVALNQNYPNPFNPATMVSYALPATADIALTVFDVTGRQIRVLASGRQPAGTYEVTFDASRLPSGIYFYRLEAGSFTETKSMMVLR
jgi:hypothetical protein